MGATRAVAVAVSTLGAVVARTPLRGTNGVCVTVLKRVAWQATTTVATATTTATTTAAVANVTGPAPGGNGAPAATLATSTRHR